MKNLSAIEAFALVSPLLLLCGCSQQETAELKARIANLEARQKVIEESVVGLLKTSHAESDGRDTNLTAAIQLQRDYLDQIGGLILEHLTNSNLHAKSQPVARVESLLERQLAKPVEMREGVPLKVYNEIALRAVKQWPKDYQKQQNYIRAEADNYRKLHR